MRPLKAATEPMVTDAALTPRHHFLCHCLTRKNRAEQVSIEHRAHILLGNADGIVRIGLATFGRDVATGIVDENVDRAQLLRRRLDHPRYVGAGSEIAEDTDGSYAMHGSNFSGDRRQRRTLAIFRRSVFAHAVDRDIGAEAC